MRFLITTFNFKTCSMSSNRSCLQSLVSKEGLTESFSFAFPTNNVVRVGEGANDKLSTDVAFMASFQPFYL